MSEQSTTQALDTPTRPQSPIIKEFCPSEGFYSSIPPKEGEQKIAPVHAGTLCLRTDDYNSSLAKFDRLFEEARNDALEFEPPIELDRNDVKIVQYGGGIIKHIFGIEIQIPLGVEVCDTYSRIHQTEFLL